MKKNFLKTFGLGIAMAGLLSGCVSDDDTSLPDYSPLVFGEDFEVNAVDGNILDTPGWTNFAEQGNKVWRSQYYGGNNYAEYSSFTSDPQDQDPVNVGWLVSPDITLGEHENEKLIFEVSQSFVSNAANSLQVLISTDYDGSNPATATWTPLQANIPGVDAEYFAFQSSGEIDLSAYSGTVNIAFKVTGSGSNQQLDGSYQIDSVRIFY